MCWRHETQLLVARVSPQKHFLVQSKMSSGARCVQEAVAKQLPQRTKISFTLQRLGRQTAAWTVLQAIREELQRERATWWRSPA